VRPSSTGFFLSVFRRVWVLFWVLLSLSYSSQVRGSVVLVELLLRCVLALLGSSSVFLGSVSVLEKFDNFFKALFVRSVRSR
jgi:hypothetical protein